MSTPSAGFIKISEANHLKEDGSNYFAWKGQITLALESRALADVAFGISAKPDPADADYAAWKTNDVAARAQIGLTMDGTLLSQFDASTAAQLWTALKTRFEATTLMNLTVATAKLQAKKVGSNERMDTHITTLRRLRANVHQAGGKISEDEFCRIVANSLAHQWDKYQFSLINYTEPEKLISSLLLEDLRTNGEGSTTPYVNETALRVDDRRRAGPVTPRDSCTNCGKPFHRRENCWAAGGGAEGRAPAGWVATPGLAPRAAPAPAPVLPQTANIAFERHILL